MEQINIEEGCLAKPKFEIGDRILEINGRSDNLEDYIRSGQARSVTEWTVVVERVDETLSTMDNYNSTDSSAEMNFSIGKR